MYLFQRWHHGDALQGAGGDVPLRLGRLGAVLLQQVEVAAPEAALLHDASVLGAAAAGPAGRPTWREGERWEGEGGRETGENQRE